MADIGTQKTDLAVKRTERRLKAIYKEAASGIENKLQEWQTKHEAREKKYRQMVKDGKLSQKDFEAWMRGQVFQQKQWEAKHEEIGRILYNADTAAANIISDGKIGVFLENANYICASIGEDKGIRSSFTLYDENTVIRLITDGPQILPKAKEGVKKGKAFPYYNKLMDSAITQGIIQGETIPQIAKRIARVTGESNYKNAVRNARTAYTGAQNAGRIEGLHQAQKLGIDVKKKWLAITDSRTRDAHIDLNGQIQEVDDPFDSDFGDIMFPGDPTAHPANVYNCRCTLVYVYPKYPSSINRRDANGENVGDMTYQEWKESKQKQTEQPYKNEKEETVQQERARFDELRIKYGNAENAMLFGTTQDVADYTRTQQTVHDYAMRHDDFMTAYETQIVTHNQLQSWLTTPTQEQINAIHTYARNGYKGMNNYLRKGGSLQGVDKGEIYALQSYLLDNHTREDMILKRGISVRSLSEMLGDGWQGNLAAMTGKEMTDKGFMSTSPFSSGNFGKNAVMYIKAPKGTHGAYIAGIVSGDTKTEQEFLLPHGTSVEVTKAYTTQNKYGDTIPVIECKIRRMR